MTAPLMLPLATDIGNPTVNIIIFALFVVATLAIVVARYGSVVFTSLLAGADAAEGRRRAQEILDGLHESPFAGGAVPRGRASSWRTSWEHCAASCRSFDCRA